MILEMSKENWCIRVEIFRKRDLDKSHYDSFCYPVIMHYPVIILSLVFLLFPLVCTAKFCCMWNIFYGATI